MKSMFLVIALSFPAVGFAQEPVQDEPAQLEPVQEEPVQEEPVQNEPAREEPVQNEPAPVETDQPEPIPVEPDQPEPAQPAPAQAAETTVEAPKFGFKLQYRPRFEKTWIGNLNARPARGNFQLSHRARLTVDGTWSFVTARASLQDARVWASETNTLGDFTADGLDVHEAWVQIGKTFGVRVGRQEINVDGQRLIGAVGWTNQGRSFDAVLAFGEIEDWVKGKLIAARVPDGGDHDMFVLHAESDIGPVHVSVPLILQTNEGVANNARGPRTADWTRFTGGAYAKGKHDALTWRLEGYGQGGTSSAAYMVGGRVGYALLPQFQPSVWFDVLSGDDPASAETNEAFDTLFGTNHKFYGFMDRFLNVPVHTSGGGLIDVAVKANSVWDFGKFHFALHYFQWTTDTAGQSSGPIGIEADLVYTIKLFDPVTLQAGTAIFVDVGDFAEGKNNTVHDWTYLQVDVKL